MTTSDLGLGGSGPDVEVYVGAALAHTGGTLNTQHLASTVQYSTVTILARASPPGPARS